MELTAEVKDYAQIVAAVATIFAVGVAALSLRRSARSFKEQTEIQAEHAAHTAVQEHMKLRVDNLVINEIEFRLNGFPDGLDALDQAEHSLYWNIAEHGIAMAEYVYKLVGEDDQGWRATVEEWVRNYEPYLLGIKIFCIHYQEDFVSLIEKALDTSRESFCKDPE
jgi:hypothetical protein